VTDHDLIMNNVSWTHSGIYTCHGEYNDNDIPFEVNSELIVAGKL